MKIFSFRNILIYAIDSKNGKDLWSYEMEASGSAPLIIYEIDGKEYLSEVFTGGIYRNYKKKLKYLYVQCQLNRIYAVEFK